MTLKTLLESGFDIGLDDYPIWNENYRNTLNNKIINHYLFYEIGQETPAKFRHYLNTKMHEIMPYYNELYRTTQFDYNPLNSADYTIEYTKKIDNTSEGTSSGRGKTDGTSSSNTTGTSNNEITSNSKGAKVDTPQSQLEVDDINGLSAASELNYAKNVSNENLSNQSEGRSTDSTTSETSSSNENIQKGTETFKQHLVGDYGVKSTQALIKEEREIILNIDTMIIAELQNCFMLVW